MCQETLQHVPPPGTSSTQVATTAFVTSSPIFTGVPTAPTAVLGTNTTQVATTAFVNIGTLNKYDNMYEVLQMSKPSDQDIYNRPFNNFASYPFTSIITNDDVNISVPLFSDASRNVIDSHILSDFPAPAGKFYYYPNGNTENNETPVWVDTSDTSGYKLALAKTYAYAPNTTEYTMYKSKVLQYVPSGAIPKSINLIDTYFKQRGYPTATPKYHSSKANLFAIQVGYELIAQAINYSIGIEFVYDSSGLPNKLWLSIAPYTTSTPLTAYMGLFINDKATIDAQVNSSAYYVQPQEILVTQKISDYLASKDTSGSRLAYYDKLNKRIHINSPGTKTQTYTGSAPTFDASWNEIFSFGNFNGSFQILKRNSDGTLSPCSPNVQECSLVQISEKMSFNWTLNGSTNNCLFNLVTNDVFSGLYITKFGMGRDSFPMYVVNSITNAFSDADVTEQSAGVGGRGRGGISRNIGDNPYTTLRERFSYGASVFSSDLLSTINFSVNLNGVTKNQLYNSIPEIFSALNVLNSQVVTTPADSFLQVMSHELYHGTVDSQVSEWAGNNVNTEGNALAQNLITQYFMNGIDSSGNDIGEIANIHIAWEAYFIYYLLFLMRGVYPRSNTTYSTKTNNIKNYTSTTGMYGEAMFMIYMMFQEDTLYQILRRTNDILAVSNDYLYNNGLVNGGVKALSVEAIHEAEKQAFSELMLAKSKSLEYEQFFANFCVSMLVLRNNSSIPEKYRTSFPYWVYNRSADYRTTFLSLLRPCSMWSDLDQSRPMNPVERVYSGSALSLLRNEGIIPMWPRVDASGVINYKAGSWNTAGTVWTPSTFAYATSITDANNSTDVRRKLVYEDLTCVAYVIPTGTVTGTPTAGTTTGVSTKVDTVTVNVHRGDWLINVVQFIPDGSGGIWRERGWTSSKKDGVYNALLDDWDDASGSPLTTTIDFSTFTPAVYNAVTYFPKLVCVNKGVHGVADYGRPKATYSDQRRFSGRLSFSATVS
jgi:hypothetical protein